jgi:glycerophosphoryl diester phosphodiesterase
MPSWLRETPVAHRGLHDQAAGVPENSLAAFRAAADAGYAMEFDVRLSADGIVMVFHDAKLKRLTGRPGLVAETPSAALRQLHLHGTGETIPTLTQVLQVIAGRVPLLIEVKNYGNDPVGPLEQGGRTIPVRSPCSPSPRPWLNGSASMHLGCLVARSPLGLAASRSSMLPHRRS